MSRVQLALNVTNIDEAVSFYEKLLGTPVSKRKPGYANFAVENPPLKLVLIEGPEGGTLNHLGIEVATGEEVEAAEDRISAEGLETTGVDKTACCYAFKTETWVADPDGAPWEIYVKTGDSDEMSNRIIEGDTACCAPATLSDPAALSDPATLSESVSIGTAPSPTTSDDPGCC